MSQDHSRYIDSELFFKPVEEDVNDVSFDYDTLNRKITELKRDNAALRSVLKRSQYYTEAQIVPSHFKLKRAGDIADELARQGFKATPAEVGTYMASARIKPELPESVFIIVSGTMIEYRFLSSNSDSIRYWYSPSQVFELKQFLRIKDIVEESTYEHA